MANAPVPAFELSEASRIFASKHECSPLAHKAGVALVAEVERLREVLKTADDLVSKAHDVMWASYPEWEGESGRREPLNAAAWKLHELLRGALEGGN